MVRARAQAPKGGDEESGLAAPPLMVQLTDMDQVGILKSDNLDEAHMNKLMPYPLKFHQVVL